jgi:pimeloyl-ACP methyl ester carboxylesterase
MPDAAPLRSQSEYQLQRGKIPLPFVVQNVFWFLFKPWLRRLLQEQAFRPKRFSADAGGRALLATAEERQWQVDGQVVRGWQWGEGAPVLVAHGLNGAGVQLREIIEALLAAELPVLTFDAPGHGQSAGDSSSYFQFSHCLRAIISEQSIRAAIGHSLGCGALLNACDKENTYFPLALVAPPVHLREMLIASFDKFGISPQIYQAWIGEYEARYGYDLVRDNPVNLYPGHNAPIHIFHSADDKITPFAETLELVTKEPQIQLHRYGDLGHKQILKNSEVIADIIAIIGNNSAR